MKNYYITTPIYYVNGEPHIGSAMTTIAADVLARYKRLRGVGAYFLTGTDENATKVVEAAQKSGRDTMEFVNQLSHEFEIAWKHLHIDYDDFIRTTEQRHIKVVQEFFSRLVEKGYAYKDVYEGWYSVADETFLRDSEVEDGVSKESGRPVQRVQEENYFFKLSAFGDRLLEHYRHNPEFWQPEFRANEVVKFIEDGLRDMCMTRKNTGWGIEVPGDPERVIYVWFDALINYLSATGWPDNQANYDSLWPADLHLVGKEIFVRFHATLWPAMLMALDLPLPKVVFGHGWWTVGGEKGSKSAGNLPHPTKFVEELVCVSGCSIDAAADALRYLLLRDMRFGEDSEYSRYAFMQRFNSDLANDLGNVLNRTLAMSQKYFEGRLPTARADDAIGDVVKSVIVDYEKAFKEFRFDRALEVVWSLVGVLNKYIDERAPWSLMKQGNTDEAACVLFSTLEGVRITSRLVSPFMPFVADEIDKQLGIEKPVLDPRWLEVEKFGLLPAGHQYGAPQPIFPRIDLKALPSEEVQGNKKEVEVKVSEEQQIPPVSEATQPAPSDLISIDDFKKVQLKVARITQAELHPNANKLLKLTIDVGNETRILVAGIAETYTPEQLIGKEIIVLVNLKPAVIRGVESQGMLLAADLGGKAIVLTPDQEVPPGSPIR